MKLTQWFQPPRVVLTLFIALMTVCALALGWLGWQVVVQDRAVEAQRRQEQVERAADRAVAAIVRALSVADVNVTVTTSGDVDMTPPARLAYVPAQTAPRPVRAEIFAEAEALEFSSQNRSRAADAYRRLAESSEAQLRTEALMRLARVLRRERKWSEALRAYASLEEFDAAHVAGMPASLVARTARCSTLAESGDQAAARREASAVWADLTAGRWSITKATLETYLNELRALAPDVALPADWDDRMALAAAAQWAFEQQAASGRGALAISRHAVSVSWEREAGAWKARFTAPGTWRALWADLEHGTNTVLRVLDAEGCLIHGSGPARGQTVYRAAQVTGLPWSVSATEAANAVPSQSWTARRRLLVAGLLVFALVVGAGSLLIARAMEREFAVARLQSGFVSAVSHEFRTPLTSIRQLAEMLARGRMETEPHKQRAYELMLAENDRLRRLAESLLDFGRMQSGAYTFRRDRLEAAEWARTVAAEFQETVRNRGYVIEVTDARGKRLSPWRPRGAGRRAVEPARQCREILA
jgi:signal transduction histidine kinase